MAHRPGPEADAGPDGRGGLLHAAGRMVGFLLLTAPALAAVAALVLLPAYGELARTRHRRDCERARTARLRAVAQAQRRLCDALRANDPVLTARLAMWQGTLWPEKEVVVVDPDAPTARPPGLITADAVPDPSPPDGTLIRWAAHLRDPATRRGLFILAAGAMLAAMLLFGGSSRSRIDPRPR